MRSHTVRMAVTAMAIVTALAAPAMAGGRPLSATLVPAGDADASGTAMLTVNPGQEEVCYDLSWQNVDGTVTSAHIHNSAGAVVVTLFGPPGEAAPRNFAGTDSATGCDPGDATRAEARDIIQNPGDYFVNIHSTAYPPGAIQGTLSK